MIQLVLVGGSNIKRERNRQIGFMISGLRSNHKSTTVAKYMPLTIMYTHLMARCPSSIFAILAVRNMKPTVQKNRATSENATAVMSRVNRSVNDNLKLSMFSVR